MAADGTSNNANTEVPEQGEETENRNEPLNTSPPRKVEPAGKTPSETSNKRSRANDEVIKTYVPQWGVLTTDAIASSVPPSAREVGPEFCRGLILPRDRALYDNVSAVDACTELMGLLSMASPWAAVIADRVGYMQSEFQKVEELKARAVKAEEDLRKSKSELERVTGRVKALSDERDLLSDPVKEMETLKS